MTGPSIGTSGSLDTLYTANQAPIVVDGAVTISDPDSATLSTGYVAIVFRYLTGDRLNFVNNDAAAYGNITASFDANSGILSFVSANSTATVAQWQAAYRAVTFESTGQYNLIRSIAFSVSDGTAFGTSSQLRLPLTTVSVKGNGIPYYQSSTTAAFNEIKVNVADFAIDAS